ncbi:Rubrofusarin-specific efflux pump aurT [Cladobotryum mycophilum]|uniref:Rubrofusarin-specific efflux pump aurT n=1 Tax=Cladobotryum mycophilum TaxID=491253 RepID=A0ABR0SCY8_9HYPO
MSTNGDGFLKPGAQTPVGGMTDVDIHLKDWDHAGPRSVGSREDILTAEQQQQQDESQYVTGTKLVLIVAALYASIFLVALDRTIIATAVPKISSYFHALDDIGWYASAYLLTSCATQLLWGRIYTFYSTKLMFLISILLFEVGSAVCGAAPTSTGFIIGRAIAGIGSAGISSGSTVIVTQILPLQKRPAIVGGVGSMFGISSIIGPLLGGAFTDHVSWRWCFYINLPIGAIVLAILVPFLNVPQRKLVERDSSVSRQLIRLDPVGTALFLPSVICFLLALQWGGSQYQWNSARIIALFVLAGVLMIAFTGVQVWRQEDATIPPRIAKQRSIAFGAVFSGVIGAGLISILYALPIWFQAIKGRTAVQSGIDTIPLVLSLVVGTIMSGIIISRTGYYIPFMFISCIFLSIGSGLITTFKVSTGHQAWIGYQVIFGLGLGFGMQQPSLAAQNVLDQKDISTGVSLMFFAQSLGGAVFVCVSQSVFNNFLRKGLLSVLSPADAAKVIFTGATELSRVVSPDKLPDVLLAYNYALYKAFIVSLAVSCFLVVPTLGMEWRRIPQTKPEAKGAEKLEG